MSVISVTIILFSVNIALSDLKFLIICSFNRLLAGFYHSKIAEKSAVLLLFIVLVQLLGLIVEL